MPRTSLRRLLLTIDDLPCPFQCTYCFTRFPQYEGSTRLADLRSDPEMLMGIDVVYPACDTDLFTRADALHILEEVAALGASVSVSTKAIISRARLERLVEMTHEMARDGRVLKIGVSLTSKSRSSILEPNVPSYSSRMSLLETLGELGIATALVLRPLQVDVPIQEYEEILAEAAGVCRYVLFGDEWLPESATQEPAIRGFEVTSEPVTWLPGTPMWNKQSVAGRESHLADVAHRLGMEGFTSDAHLMARLIEASWKGTHGGH